MLLCTGFFYKGGAGAPNKGGGGGLGGGGLNPTDFWRGGLNLP